MTWFESINQLWTVPNPDRKDMYSYSLQVKTNCLHIGSQRAQRNMEHRREWCEQMCHTSLRQQSKFLGPWRCKYSFDIPQVSPSPQEGQFKGVPVGLLFQNLFGSSKLLCRFVEMFLGRIRRLRGRKEKEGWQSLDIRMKIYGLSGWGLEEKANIFCSLIFLGLPHSPSLVMAQTCPRGCTSCGQGVVDDFSGITWM